jgi:hypothetical protein
MPAPREAETLLVGEVHDSVTCTLPVFEVVKGTARKWFFPLASGTLRVPEPCVTKVRTVGVVGVEGTSLGPPQPGRARAREMTVNPEDTRALLAMKCFRRSLAPGDTGMRWFAERRAISYPK